MIKYLYLYIFFDFKVNICYFSDNKKYKGYKMNNEYLLNFLSEFYSQNKACSEQFVNTLADFLLANKNTLVTEEFRPYINNLHSLWTINALPEILKGRIYISDALLNSFLGQIVSHINLVKTIDANCYGNGSIDFMVEHKFGRFLIKGELNKLIHNKKESQMQFCISKKEDITSGIGMIFQKFTAGIANKVLEDSLNKNYSNGIKFNFGQDVITMDFKEFLEKSILNKYKLMDKLLINLIEINKVTVLNGGLEVGFKFKHNEN